MYIHTVTSIQKKPKANNGIEILPIIILEVEIYRQKRNFKTKMFFRQTKVKRHNPLVTN